MSRKGGSGFKVVRNAAEAEEYLSRVAVSVIAQQYVHGPLEAGLFYYRLPSESRGTIFAITEKIFPVLIGDGQRTVEALILADPRASLLSEIYLRRFDRIRDRVLMRGQSLRLVEAGNHAQGCLFRDGSPSLEQGARSASRRDFTSFARVLHRSIRHSLQFDRRLAGREGVQNSRVEWSCFRGYECL
jgi:hypothetical protein